MGPQLEIGRYVLYAEIASGGMATVHFGRLQGPAGFSRTVAVKRLHAHLAKNPEFVAMFLDEARLVARIRHPNVVPTLDVVTAEGELLLVMEYVHGQSLSRLMRRTRRHGNFVPPAIASALITNVLYGLQAAHDATNENGGSLRIVHRDVSPQNILVGADGVARVLDFGVAKAVGRVQETDAGTLKGKIGYMSPEQLTGDGLDRRSDVFSAAVVLWELFTGERLFQGEHTASLVHAVLRKPIPPPSSMSTHVDSAVDDVVLRGLERDPDKRFATARDMAVALEDALPPATTRRVSEWVEQIAGETLTARAWQMKNIEADSVSIPDLRGVLDSIPDSRVSKPESRALADSKPDMVLTPTTGSIVRGHALSSDPGRERSRRSWVVAAVVVGLALGGVALALSSNREQAPGNAASEPDASSVTPEPTSVSEASASAAPEAPPSTTAVASTPAPSASSATRPSARAPRPAPRPPQPSAKPAIDCSNPFTFDAQGNKRPRPECFR